MKQQNLLWIPSILVATASIISGEIITSVDTPLPYHTYRAGTNCKGQPLVSGTTVSIVALKEEGAFCENTDQILPEGAATLQVHTKLVVDSCDAIPTLGYASLSSYVCSDPLCENCTDRDGSGFAAKADLKVPNFDATAPIIETCWEILTVSTGVRTLNHFDPKKADETAVEAYWKVLVENSCLADTVSILPPQPPLPSTKAPAPPPVASDASPLITRTGGWWYPAFAMAGAFLVL